MMRIDYVQYFLSTYSLLMIIDCVISLELKELHVPTHVALGAKAQLSCHWKLSPADVLYSVKWYKDGSEFFRHVPRDSVPMRKFMLPGVDVENSDAMGASIVLSRAVFQTAGRYRCEVSGERPLFPTVSQYADMYIVDPPLQAPVISGLHRTYHLDDHVKVICTSGRSRPACQLQWYVNGELVPAATLPLFNQVNGDERESSTLLLDFILTERHFRKKTVKVKCLATLATVYWQSNEESAVLIKVKSHERILLPDVQNTSYRASINNVDIFLFIFFIRVSVCAYITL